MTEKKKVFETLSKVKCKIEKKGQFNYVSWTDAWEETKKKFPEVTFKVYENELTTKVGDKVKKSTMPYFESNAGAFVKVGVTIENQEYIEHYPILNFANKAVKGEMLDVFQVNKAIKRALTKALAYHGLGLYVYKGEDLPSED